MQNGIMIQYFHWYTPKDGVWWKEVSKQAKYLASMGVTAAWLPPAYKGSSGSTSVGYDVYDLYDMGEFDQKGSVHTRYGTVEEFKATITALREAGIQVIADIVLNQKGGGDETETVLAVKVNPDNRNEVISDPFEIEAYTKFVFPGRQQAYSAFEWTHHCFSGVDYDKQRDETGIFRFVQEWGNDWEEVIDDEKGNYDYLMFNDLDFRNPALRDELNNWAKWYHDHIGFDGVRLDAVKHISPRFYNEWLVKLRENTNREIFAVGEYWAPGALHLLLAYLDATEDNMSLFDSSLHNNFHTASQAGKDYDLRNIFKDTLVEVRPDKAVTVVENHDTQPLQALEAPVEHWFKPLAYALILLRQEGYPCIFYPDLHGAAYTDKGHDGNQHDIVLEKVAELETLMNTRCNHAYGTQRDYFDHGNCIGWTREGDDEHTGCAVVISNGDAGVKNMEIGKRYAGQLFKDILEKHSAEVVVDEEGFADFFANPGSVSVWVAT